MWFLPIFLDRLSKDQRRHAASLRLLVYYRSIEYDQTRNLVGLLPARKSSSPPFMNASGLERVTIVWDEKIRPINWDVFREMVRTHVRGGLYGPLNDSVKIEVVHREGRGYCQTHFSVNLLVEEINKGSQ